MGVESNPAAGGLSRSFRLHPFHTSICVSVPLTAEPVVGATASASCRDALMLAATCPVLASASNLRREVRYAHGSNWQHSVCAVCRRSLRPLACEA